MHSFHFQGVVQVNYKKGTLKVDDMTYKVDIYYAVITLRVKVCVNCYLINCLPTVNQASSEGLIFYQLSQ